MAALEGTPAEGKDVSTTGPMGFLAAVAPSPRKDATSSPLKPSFTTESVKASFLPPAL